MLWPLLVLLPVTLLVWMPNILRYNSQTNGRLATIMAVALSRTYQYVQALPKGSVKEYHLFKAAAMITKMPRLKIPTRGTFFDIGI